MTERKGERSKFDPLIEYYSPYRPPGKAPLGFEWKCTWRHPDKSYPERWKLVPVVDSDQSSRPNNPYGVDPEKMAKDWDRATSRKGRPPIGGAQDD